MNRQASAVSKISASKSILNRHERTFKRGSLMFIEGETSYEMFILRSGKIRILKQEGENTVELAVLGPGSVIGELSLLDHQPRSATAQVVEDTVVTVIDEELFSRTLQKIPPWFGSIIQVVVKRLRDTMKKASDDIIQKSISGFIKVALLLNESDGIEISSQRAITLSKLKDTVFAVIGLGGMDVEYLLLHLILKEMALIHRNEKGQEFVILRSIEILQLYMNYLRTKLRKSALVGENFDEKTFQLIGFIIEAGERNGRKEGDKLMRVGLPQVEVEIERSGNGRYVDPDALEQLEKSKLIYKQDDMTQSAHGNHKRVVFIYNIETMKRVSLLRIWLPVFREEIHF
jgi:CRP/FNR family cyclic AMP-dependent transcriptional regulator